jgi:hypothetical protein
MYIPPPCDDGERIIRGKFEGKTRFYRLKIHIQGMNVALGFF